MKRTLGEKISDLRKTRRMTQDELADVMGVSSQAVSKWENNLSIPDLPILMQLSDYFNVSLDDLVREKEETVKLVAAGDRKNINDMFLRVNVLSVAGDKVKVNLPLALVKMAVDMGVEIPQINGNNALKSLDLKMIIQMIESGVIGKLVEVDSAEGDHVEVVVE